MAPRTTAFYLSIPLILSFTLSASPAPQIAPQAPDSEPQAVFHSSARLVQVSVVIEDKKGNPVTGLKKEDFTVMDDGKPQQIAFFAAPSQAAEPTSPHPATRVLPPNVFTNRFDLKGEEPPSALTVVLFDLLNTSSLDQSYVRKEVIHFLQTLKPQDHVAVYGLTNELFVLHEFTRDASDLVAAAESLSPQELAAYDATHTPPVDLVTLGADPQWARLQNSINNANGQIADADNIGRINTTVSAMEAIASHVAGIPGRKSLVWISGGIPIQIGVPSIGTRASSDPPDVGGTVAAIGPRVAGTSSNLDDTGGDNQPPPPDRETYSGDEVIKRAADSLNRSNMAVYAIDARGVELDNTLDPSNHGIRLSNQVRNTASFNNELVTRDSSKLLADRTGGLAFFGDNDIRGAIRRAFDDGRYAYNIGFYPTHGKWNGAFRKIKIRVKGEDLRLRYRAGYYAFADRSDPQAVIATDLQQAADSPLDATNLGMIVTAKPSGAGASRTLDLHIGIDPKQLLLRESGDHRKGALDLFFLQRDASGKTLSAEKQHMDVNLEVKQYEYLAKAAMVLDRHLTLSPQSTEIRVVLRDAGSGSLGSVTLPASAFVPDAASPAPASKPDK